MIGRVEALASETQAPRRGLLEPDRRGIGNGRNTLGKPEGTLRFRRRAIDLRALQERRHVGGGGGRRRIGARRRERVGWPRSARHARRPVRRVEVLQHGPLVHGVDRRDVLALVKVGRLLRHARERRPRAGLAGAGRMEQRDVRLADPEGRPQLLIGEAREGARAGHGDAVVRHDKVPLLELVEPFDLGHALLLRRAGEVVEDAQHRAALARAPAVAQVPVLLVAARGARAQPVQAEAVHPQILHHHAPERVVRLDHVVGHEHAPPGAVVRAPLHEAVHLAGLHVR
mmetsp:Transcript_20653/g.62849  ORF Transcript_20653/g.62849 Transcript_20653/m.62849 type:complete len:286 (-) Transcript_20653:682-1539(-)